MKLGDWVNKSERVLMYGENKGGLRILKVETLLRLKKVSSYVEFSLYFGFRRFAIRMNRGWQRSPVAWVQ